MPKKPNSSILESLKNFNQLPDSAHVRKPVVLALFAISDASLYRRIKAKKLPPPEKFSECIAAWNVGKLRRVIASGGKEL